LIYIKSDLPFSQCDVKFGYIEIIRKNPENSYLIGITGY